jgi:hypothetical protein
MERILERSHELLRMMTAERRCFLARCLHEVRAEEERTAGVRR